MNENSPFRWAIEQAAADQSDRDGKLIHCGAT
jgi:hypothetical protein